MGGRPGATTPPPPSSWASSAPVESEPKSGGFVANGVADGRSSFRRPAPRTSKCMPFLTLVLNLISRKLLQTPAPPLLGSSVPGRVNLKSARSFVGYMVDTVADGFIWSTGNAMAHRAMDAIIGPRTIQIENVPAAAPAAQCINRNDISKCQLYMDMLSECRKSGSATPIAVSF
ncbi:hypothetical protein Tco_0997361 [Tanacetum coccineum]